MVHAAQLALPGFNFEGFTRWLEACDTIEMLLAPPLMSEKVPATCPEDEDVFVDGEFLTKTKKEEHRPKAKPKKRSETFAVTRSRLSPKTGNTQTTAASPQGDG